MTVCIPWTKEDVDYLINEGFKDTYLAMKDNPRLRVKFQRAANAVKDNYSNVDKFRKQHLIDIYYDIVTSISKKTSEEWANYEREYQEQTLKQEAEKEAVQEALPLIEKAEKSENFRDFIYSWKEFSDFVSKSKHQELYDVKEYAASRIYREVKQNRNIRTALENLLSQRLDDGTTTGEFVQSLGINKEELRKYCIVQKHNNLLLDINENSSMMQEELHSNKNYHPDKLEFLNFLLKEVKELYRENGIIEKERAISEEAEHVLNKAHEISSLYSLKLMDVIKDNSPRVIARDETIKEFRRIKNIAYRNTLQIPNKEAQKKIIKSISNVDEEYNKKIDKFARRYLLKKQDELYFAAKDSAKDGNKALFETDFDVTHDSSGNLFIHPKINTKRQPIFLDNSKKYENAKKQLMGLSRNYSITLDEEPEDLEKLEKTLITYDKIHQKACRDMITDYGFIDGKIKRIPTEQELDDLDKIYYKLIGQSIKKAQEAVEKNDKVNARKYLDLAKTLKEERKKDIYPLRQKRLEIIKSEEPLKSIKKPKQANLETISAATPKSLLQIKPNLEERILEEPEEITEAEEIESRKRREQIKAEVKRTEEIYNKYNLVLSQKHELTKEEAYQKANKLLAELQRQHQKTIDNARVSWNEDKSEMNFNLEIKGIPVQGIAYLCDGEITIGGEFNDWRAKMFKGKIEKEIRNFLEQNFS